MKIFIEKHQYIYRDIKYRYVVTVAILSLRFYV